MLIATVLLGLPFGCNVSDDVTFAESDGGDVGSDVDAGEEDSAPCELQQWYRDFDGDEVGADSASVMACTPPEGYVAIAGDCNDDDPTVAPTRPELCDDIDHDCDGELRANAADRGVFYADGDNDGFGDVGVPLRECQQPVGYVDNSLDCDDTNAEIFPSREVCDGFDNDCDQAIDESGADDAQTFYRDRDGDGAGDPNTSLVACSAPANHVDNDGDCNDNHAGIGPEVEETCDGVDNDCDQVTDESSFAWYFDGDNDGFGTTSVPSITQCSQPSGYSPRSGDCNDGNNTIYPGAPEDCGEAVDANCDGRTGTFDGDGDNFAACDDCDDGDSSISPSATDVCDGRDNDCDGQVDEDPTVPGVGTWFVDADGDGFGATTSVEACNRPDGHVAIPGDCDDAKSMVNPSQPEVCDDTVDDNCDGSLRCAVVGVVPVAMADLIGPVGGLIGYSTRAGDVDGDGVLDLLTGEPVVGQNAGVVRVWLGPFSQGDLGASDIEITGDSASVLGVGLAIGNEAIYAGGSGSTGGVFRFPLPLTAGSYTLADGDVLASGATEVQLGFGVQVAQDVVAPGAETVLWLQLMLGSPIQGEVRLVTGSDELTIASSTETTLGGLVQLIPDINGDGAPEVYISAYQQLPGQLFMSPISANLTAADADVQFLGTATASPALHGIGDFTGDGRSDFAVRAANSFVPTIYIVDLDLTDVDTVPLAGREWLSPNTTLFEGLATSIASDDFNGDGFSDLLVASANEVWVYYGPRQPPLSKDNADAVIVLGESAAANVFELGDLDGDGFADFAVSSVDFSNLSSSQFWVFFGGADSR